MRIGLGVLEIGADPADNLRRLIDLTGEAADAQVDQERWDRSEMPAYAEHVRRLGATTLTVNYLADGETLPDDGSFGGAFVVSPDGTVRAQKPLGEPGPLCAELP